MPVNKVDNLQELLRNTPIHSEEIAIEPHDVIPTYLQNEGAGRLGEDLINIYDTPSHTTKILPGGCWDSFLCSLQ